MHTTPRMRTPRTSVVRTMQVPNARALCKSKCSNGWDPCCPAVALTIRGSCAAPYLQSSLQCTLPLAHCHLHSVMCTLPRGASSYLSKSALVKGGAALCVRVDNVRTVFWLRGSRFVCTDHHMHLVWCSKLKFSTMFSVMFALAFRMNTRTARSGCTSLNVWHYKDRRTRKGKVATRT